LTARRAGGTLGHMVVKLRPLDPDRSGRRLRVLAAAHARAVRERVQPRRATADRIREIIAVRRRVVG
jgi:hypothetical protein